MHLFEPVPKFLVSKETLVSTVMFTAIFSIVFLLACLPTSDNVWLTIEPGLSLLFTASFFLICLLVIIFSSFLMIKFGKYMVKTLFHYVLWCVVEILVICSLYSFFTLEADAAGLINLEDGMGFGALMMESLVYVTISIGVPYCICGLYFAIDEKNDTIIRLMNYGEVVSDVNVAPLEQKRITLFDNNGVMKLSVNLSNLYYIESDDNYIKVWYEDSGGDLKQYMLRCRLKTVEESFSEENELVRCHRKYMVNMTKVKILRKEKEGYCLQLELDSVDQIPVSKTYEERVLALFNSR